MTLLDEIERFMRATLISASAFGRRSGSGKDLVRELRKGRTPRKAAEQLAP